MAVVVLFDSTVTVWDLHRQEPLTVLQRWGQRDSAMGHTGGVNAACVSSDGSRVLTVAKDCTGRIWDVAVGASVHVLHGEPIVSFLYHSPFMILFSSGRDIDRYTVGCCAVVKHQHETPMQCPKSWLKRHTIHQSLAFYSS